MSNESDAKVRFLIVSNLIMSACSWLFSKFNKAQNFNQKHSWAKRGL